MTFEVFISHSMAASDRGLLDSFVDLLTERDVAPYVAERDPMPGKYLWTKVEQRIKRADLFAVLWTVDGAGSQFVNQEVGAAFAVKKDVLPIVEKGVKVTGALAGREYVEFDRKNPEGLFKQLQTYFARARRSEPSGGGTEAWEALLLVAGILVLALVVILILMLAAG